MGRKAIRWLLFAGIAALVVSFILIGVSYLFYVREVEVEGMLHTAKEEVLELAGVRAGDTLSSINSRELERTLKENLLWVKEVTVKKSWSGTIRILISEYEIAYGIRAKDSYLLVSPEFVVLDRIRELPEQYPKIILPTQSVFPEIGEIVETDHGEISATAEITAKLESFRDDFRVLEINLSEPYYYTLKTENGVLIRIGDTEKLLIKLEIAREILLLHREDTWNTAEIVVSDPKRASFRVLN